MIDLASTEFTRFTVAQLAVLNLSAVIPLFLGLTGGARSPSGGGLQP